MKAALSLLSALLASLAASDGEPVPLSPSDLLARPEVVGALRLTAAQKSAVAAIEIRLKVDRGRDPRWDAQEASRIRADAAVVTGLDAAQRVRLRGLQYQSLDFQALRTAELQKALGLTPEQIGMLEGLALRYDDARMHLAKVQAFVVRATDAEGSPVFSLDPSAERENARLDQVARAQADAILASAQREEYRRWLGPPLPSIVGKAPSVAVVLVS